MENFNEKYDRLTTGGVTRFRYPIPGKLPSWMSGMEDALRRSAGEPTSRFMTPDEINKIRQSRGETPYSRAEFETFGIEKAGPRSVPLKGYDEPASSGLSPTEVRDLQKAANDARKAGQMSDIRGSETPGSSVPEPAEPVKPTDPVKPEPVKPTDPVKPEPVKPEPKDRYRELIAQGKTKEAEAVGKEMWAQKYKSGFKSKDVDVTTAAQKDLIKAAGKYNLPRVQRIGATMEAYDVVLDYLLSEGHADTVEEAHYVMMQMDAEYIQSIVEKFPDVKGTLNPWESPTTGKSGVKYVTDPKTGKPVQIRNPLYKGV